MICGRVIHHQPNSLYSNSETYSLPSALSTLSSCAPCLLREIGGIEDFAFFTGNGPYFDIWSPARAHSHYAAMGDKRLLRVLEHLCREKGVTL